MPQLLVDNTPCGALFVCSALSPHIFLVLDPLQPACTAGCRPQPQMQTQGEQLHRWTVRPQPDWHEVRVACDPCFCASQAHRAGSADMLAEVSTQLRKQRLEHDAPVSQPAMACFRAELLVGTED